MKSDRRVRTGHDHVSRREVFKTAAAVVQQAFVDDPPAIFLAWPQVARAVSKRFNVATDPNRPDVMGTMRLWTPAAAERHASRN